MEADIRRVRPRLRLLTRIRRTIASPLIGTTGEQMVLSNSTSIKRVFPLLEYVEYHYRERSRRENGRERIFVSCIDTHNF